jgi:hypothetical protein
MSFCISHSWFGRILPGLVVLLPFALLVPALARVSMVGSLFAITVLLVSSHYLR